MLKDFFSNTKGYDDTKYTDFIPDNARLDCKAAWKFAEEIGFPLTQHIEVEIPKHLSEDEHCFFQRMVCNKLRVHARDNGYDAYQLLHRSCDETTKANPQIDVLFHVPEKKIVGFQKTVGKWSFVKSIKTVTYVETVLPDGKIQSIFNHLFAATSPKFAADHPTIAYKASGPVLGDRTFYSRSLWAKWRFRFWKAKRNR